MSQKGAQRMLSKRVYYGTRSLSSITPTKVQNPTQDQ